MGQHNVNFIQPWQCTSQQLARLTWREDKNELNTHKNISTFSMLLIFVYFESPVGLHCNKIQNDTMIHRVHHWYRQNINQILNSQKNIHSSAFIIQSNITWYCTHHCRSWGRISIRGWNHKRHPIPRPDGQAMGCLSWIFWRKLTVL